MKRLNVLFMTFWYPTREHPFKGAFIRNHAKAAHLYDDVVVLHCAGITTSIKKRWQMEQEADERITEGIPTYRVRHRLLPIPTVSFVIYFWSVYRAVRRIHNQGFRFDLIHSNHYETSVLAVLIGKIYRIPVIITEHYSGFPRNLLSRRELFKARFAFHRAARILPVSHALRESIVRHGVRARFQIVPNVVDTTHFFQRSQQDEKKNVKHLLFVAFFDPIKGLPYLLQALARMRRERDDWHLDIVGDGPPRSEYEGLTADLGLADKVTFHGSKPKLDVAEHMRSADIFILPSLWENMPCVLIEAMACGLPVVSTLTGGIPEIIDTEAGMLVRPGEAAELSNAIMDMMEALNTFDRKVIAEKALRYSPQSIGELLHAIYLDAAK
ncbi:MAG: glycosyltransferase [Deltaproteobacteria bacterium]|nr:glycosyltransferase [Deltaproteobacteria bacterium]